MVAKTMNDAVCVVKPCPFCGHVVDLDDPDTLYPNGTGWKLNEKNNMRSYHNFREVPQEQWCYSLNCVTTAGGCGAEMHADSKEDAIKQWNKRV